VFTAAQAEQWLPSLPGCYLDSTNLASGQIHTITVDFYDATGITVLASAAPLERRRVFPDFVDDFNDRHGPGSPWPKAVLEEWVEGSPLAKVSFVPQQAALPDRRPGPR
jgi:hypothetical protein